MKTILYSVIDSPQHPLLSGLYRRLGFNELRLESQRKAIAELRRNPPAVVVSDFIYAYSTYYQATNVSNLDVLLQSLVKYAPDARVIVLAAAPDLVHVEKLRAIRPLHAVLTYPVTEAEMEAALRPLAPAP